MHHVRERKLQGLAILSRGAHVVDEHVAAPHAARAEARLLSDHEVAMATDFLSD